jgi:hypothetical protein
MVIFLSLTVGQTLSPWNQFFAIVNEDDMLTFLQGSSLFFDLFIYIRTYIFICVYMCIYMYTYICMCIYISLYICAKNYS